MQNWNDKLWLFSPEEFKQLPLGIELVSVNGDKVTKGVDYIDNDTRAGFMAFGIEDFDDHDLLPLFKQWGYNGK